MSQQPLPVFSIGHSTRSLETMLGLLAQSGVASVLDVRKLAGSARFPHFNADALTVALRRQGIDYWRLPALCGRRTAGEVRDLPEDHFWANASFSRYARWSRGEPFTKALDALAARATGERCAIMCAEAVWWRCHRRIIADHLLARGVPVRHIMGPGKVVDADLTRGARVCAGRALYPPPDAAATGAGAANDRWP